MYKIIETLAEAKETIEIYKDVYYMLSTEKANKILSILTIIFTLSIPITVISSFYGMNINMPGRIEAPSTFLGPYTSMFEVVIISLIITMLMYWYFRRAVGYNEIFYPLYQKKLEEENEQESAVVMQGQLLAARNKITGTVTLTANEICDYYNLQNPNSRINSENLRKTYLHELDNAGWIESLEVRNGNTKKVYYPIVVPSETSSVTTRETSETKIFPQF